MLSLISQIVSVIAGAIIIVAALIFLWFNIFPCRKDTRFSRDWEDDYNEDEDDL